MSGQCDVGMIYDRMNSKWVREGRRSDFNGFVGMLYNISASLNGYGMLGEATP